MRARGWPSVAIGILLAGCGGSSPTGPSGPPVVTAVNGATLPSGPTGSTILIEGSGFGSTHTTVSGTVLFSNGTGGTIVETIASTSVWCDTFLLICYHTVRAYTAPEVYARKDMKHIRS